MFLLLAVFTNCQKDDNHLKNDESATGAETSTTLLTGKEALQMYEIVMNHINAASQGHNNKSINAGKDITVFEDEVMRFQDQFGNLHYTFRAVHNNPGTNTFYNVVMTQNSTFKKTVLIEYAMSQKFADQFNIDGNMDNFEGQITFTPLNTDSGFPCNDTPTNPISVNPGNSSGGGGGPGNNNGGGIPGPGGSGNGNGYTYNPVFAYISLQLTVSQNEPWVEVSRSPRGTGWKSLSVSEPSPNPSLTPCGDAQIGVFVPFNAPKKIVDDIDDTNLDPCSKSVFESTKESQ